MSAPPKATASEASRTQLRVALFGSPAFALPSLRALRTQHRLVLVVAQPDKRAGRGMRVKPPATAAEARRLGLPLLQPERLRRNPEFAERLRALELDVAVTAAYGKILPAELLDVPRHGFLNVHASLLPRYRGAAPVQWALIRGEQRTGVSIMRTDPGLDTGPVCLRRALPIPPEASAAELMATLAELGAEALLDALRGLAAGTLRCLPQDESAATLAPMLTKDDGRIRWTDAAQAVVGRHRGVAVWPGSTFTAGGASVKVTKLHALEAGGAPSVPATAEPGTVLALGPEGVTVACGEGAVLLVCVQPAGKRVMPARDWANGHGVRAGVRLG